MPEENDSIDLERTLDLLEDPMLNKPLAKGQYYKAFISALDSGAELDTVIVDRLLAVCVHDLEDDKKSVIHVLRIIQSVLKRIKAGGFSALPNLLSSILAVLNIIKTSALMSKMETMQTLCFEILLSYPNDTLIEIATLHTSEVIEVLNLYCHQQIPLEIRVLPCGLILKLLKILPPEKKHAFVKENLSVWFSKLIPTTILSINTWALAGNETSNLKSLETLESLTCELIPVDYSENPQWLELLECIYNPSKYPDTMKQMLSSGSNKWHRLWITFIKLLKHQITKTTFSTASPINSMLPVVELAFKMDVTNRCRAFQCWNVLINNFRTEENEAYIVKRLKLLIIPLKSNNAKVEETAIAKLKTWWHLISCFQTKLDKFVDKVLISFLHFCFGRHVGMSPKSICIPGLLTANTKKECVQTFVELAGHLSCSGCVNVPTLNTRIITKTILVDHWSDWLYSLKLSITIFNENVGLKIEQIECLWKSFIMTVAELPDNNIRKDLFTEFLIMLENLEKQSEINDLSKVIFHLTCALFSVEKIKALLSSRDTRIPICKVISLLLSPSLERFYRKSDTTMIVTKLNPLAKYLLDSRLVNPVVLKCPNQNISIIVTALAETICGSKYEEVGDWMDLMLWPLKSSNCIIDMDYTTKVWTKFVISMYPKLKANAKDKLRAALSSDIMQSNTQLKLHLCLAILKYELENDSVVGCTKNVELLLAATNAVEDHKYVKNILIELSDIVFSIINKIQDDIYSGLFNNTLTIVKNLFKFLVPLLQDSNENDKEKTYIYENVLKHVDDVFQNKANFSWYTSLTTLIVEEMLKCTAELSKYPTIQSHVISIMKIFLSQSKSKESSIFSKVKETVESLESKIDSGKPIQPAKDDFAAPDTKALTKKVKKKETTIVNTVVENGEEYEVIKSNWKFNPRKLTENQKEKFQRKREDIPALYQDLSQSQDDFKLTAWKTDSQDASSTNSRSTSDSKSASSQNVSEILKNIQSSDVVPKIIENIFSEKKDAEISAEEKVVNDTTNKLKQSNNIKDPKSPRLALKDRVFRNVRNLIEKSSVQKDSKDLSGSLIQVENIPKTPPSKTIENTNLINTAPANLERPARLKRKPKKFDDVELISLKKSRRSSSLNDSQSEILMEWVGTNGSPMTDSQVKALDVETASVKPTSDNTEEKPTEPVVTENQTNVMNNTDTKSDIENKNPSEKINQEMARKPAVVEVSDTELPVITVSLSTEIPTATCVTEPNKPECTDKDPRPTVLTALEDNESLVGKLQEKLSTESKNITEVVDDIPARETSDANCPDEALKRNSKSDDTPKGNNTKGIRTPKQTKRQEIMEPRSKRNSARTSRIEKELAIDTVEGHPFLKIQTEKRITRKNLNSPLNNSRRKSLTDKLNKSKSDAKTPLKAQTICSKKKDKDMSPNEMESVSSAVVGDSQDKCSENTDDLPFSEDVIESSQDSTFTTISVKTTKPSLKKLTVLIPKVSLVPSVQSPETHNDELTMNKTIDTNDRDDTELPQNKTAVMDNTDLDSTENMDTEPLDSKVIEENQNSSEVIIINDEEEPIVIGSETQEIAEADTQPTPSSETQEIAEADTQPSADLSEIRSPSKTNSKTHEDDELQISNFGVNTEDDITTTMHESMDVSIKPDDENTVSSPFKDEAQRKKDFLDNTLEISPIKTMSPVRDKKSPSPETSSDYVLIKLSSPVQSNGEPFEKCDSPEIFTEDKVSPDKRDLSPPREENVVNNTSPSSSLSLKKNRPQVRSGGRAAQMLGLCVPDRLQNIMNSERSEPEEPKRSSPSNTPARRNLRILYNSVGGDSSENPEENEDNENFLKFKRVLPTSDCSPSGPILKRKLAEITDEATISPASKRKRVSFHDPPVSTTVAVQKYIEPGGIRSPQNSLLKRQERQNLRSQTILKSPKRLDNVFKLDTVLTKVVDSFTEPELTSIDITQSMSLDETPALEIVKNSDLNDVDAICPDLVGCKDLIDKIAAELSSATMKTMFLKEIEGKISTIGDLAKMTELEVNRLCIKAPKVKVAKKVLNDYASKRVPVKELVAMDTIEILDNEVSPEERCIVNKTDVEIQTSISRSDVEMQTVLIPTSVNCVQTDEMSTIDALVQTNESGAKSTKEIISSCLAERPDFVDSLCEQLGESSKQRITEKLPLNAVTDIFMKNVTRSNSKSLITRILQKQNESNCTKRQSENDLLFLQDYLSDRFDNRDLILFCSQLLSKIHSRPL